MVRRWIAGVALTALCMACGAEAQQSALDTPEAHYRQGLRELEKGDTAGASEAFGRAQKLNPGYAGAYVGLALVALEQGKAAQAEEYLKAARKKRQEVHGHLHRRGSAALQAAARGRLVEEGGGAV
ncbi:tetratricopeptide repeat protein [bacterium]|nr:tetratricopeptide repeat protein [bacterium]